MKQLIAFDLDGTLAESKQAIDAEMAELLRELLDVAKVSVISGGDWPQFDKQVAQQIPPGAKLENLFLMPTTGSKLYRFLGGAWTRVYADNFTKDEHDRIVTALDKAVKACGFDKEKSWGAQIEDRGSQITFSALGQEAPLDAKKAWDPDITKRKQLQAALADDLSDLSVKVGGSTSIDITRQGIDRPMRSAASASIAALPRRRSCSLATQSIRAATTIRCVPPASTRWRCATCKIQGTSSAASSPA